MKKELDLFSIFSNSIGLETIKIDGPIQRRDITFQIVI